MKKYLLPKDGNFYKANMHCHTIFSDGSNTPEELKEAYMEQGFSIVAFTDHDVLLSHQHLSDENFLALNGCEIEVNENDDVLWREMKTCHICCVALDPDNVTQVCYSPKYLLGNGKKHIDKLVIDKTKPDYERVYSHEGVSAMMQEARDNGFFVTYNHPNGSLEHYPDYIGYKGMHALEIHNSGDLHGAYRECPNVYDDLLREGNKIIITAGDDAHSTDWPFKDYLSGYTMIKAPNLEYKTITNALLNGHTYVSQGPVIDELWFEDGELHIKTPGVDRIEFLIGNRRENKVVWSGDQDGVPVRHASYKVKDDHSYIRVELFDKCGKRAYTNAYFIDDLLREE